MSIDGIARKGAGRLVHQHSLALLRSVKQTVASLVEDFRIDKQLLRILDATAISGWLKDVPKENSLMILAKTLNAL